MVTYDDLDILAMYWLGGMAVVFTIVYWIATHDRKPTNLPEPQPRAVVGHARWYRVTSSRINDRKGI